MITDSAAHTAFWTANMAVSRASTAPEPNTAASTASSNAWPEQGDTHTQTHTDTVSTMPQVHNMHL